MRSASFISAAIAVAVVFTVSPVLAADACQRTSDPKGDWRPAAASSGWSREKLNAAWAAATKGNYAGGMLIQHGRVVGQFGDVTTPFETRSIRKSFLSALAGQQVAEGKLRLKSTLAELGIDEKTPLTDSEKSATVRDLMASRSGIYLIAAYHYPGNERNMPARGADRPGDRYFYNNWDFNAAGVAVEKAAGESVLTLFERRIAKPLGMQDFVRERDAKYLREDVSLHPAYLFDMSVRDQARFGQLYANKGCWNGKRLIAADWIAQTTAPVSPGGWEGKEAYDYGLLWWSAKPPKGLTQRVFMARGAIQQYIMVIPELDAVLVMAVDMKTGQELFQKHGPKKAREMGYTPPSQQQFLSILEQVVAARPGA